MVVALIAGMVRLILLLPILLSVVSACGSFEQEDSVSVPMASKEALLEPGWEYGGDPVTLVIEQDHIRLQCATGSEPARFAVRQHLDLLLCYDGCGREDCRFVDWDTRGWDEREYIWVDWTRDLSGRVVEALTHEEHDPYFALEACNEPSAVLSPY